MRTFTLLLPLVLVVGSSQQTSAQQIAKLFDSSWYGFNTGAYPSGQSPSAIKAGDLDNDGDSDLVVAQQNFSNGFVVMKNQGGGSFAAPAKYNSPKASLGIVIADFNNDGKKDVALSNTGFYIEGNSVSVFLNAGKGKYGAAASYKVGIGPVGIVATDLDNDGDMDIAVCNSNSTTVSILINKGNGGFNAATNIEVGNRPFRIAAAKINNDNLIDLIVANNTQKINVLINNGSNNFSKTTLDVIYSQEIEDQNAAIASADFDNDGDNDVIFGSMHTSHSLNEIALFINNGTGSFSAPQFIGLNAFSGSAADFDVADFNNDGKLDILTCYFSGRVGDGYHVLLNKGNNVFSIPDVRPGGQSTEFIAAADVDNDHDVDVVTSDFYSLQVTVHKNAGKGKFPIPSFYNSKNATAGCLDAADYDGDGDLDLVTSASSVCAVGVTVTVMKNNGDGSFASAVAYSIRGGGVQAKFRDLNGDGKPDLIFATAISTPPYDFHTAINNGSGGFGPRQTWSMDACGWSDIETADVDNDGDQDALITEWLGCQNVPTSARRLFISRNDGHGNFSAPVIKLINSFPSCIATGDLNKDGKADIVTGQFRSVDVHLNSANSALFQAPVTNNTEQTPYDIIITDLNKDGNPDIAACTEFDYEGMSVLLGKGDGTFHAAQNYRGAYSPDLRNESGITSGDVDGDGNVDLLVGNYASNDVSIYLNKGDGTFTFRCRVGVYYSVASPILADFSGDGKKDIAALISLPPDGASSSVAVLRGTVFNTGVAESAASENKAVSAGKNANGISILNNPFKNYIDIKLDKIVNAPVTLRLTDLTGKLVATSTFDQSSQVLRFNLQNKNFNTGIYLLTVETADRSVTLKVMHQ